MGAIEEWGVDDAQDYLRGALLAFGFGRCLAESNWFVSKAMGCAYSASFEALAEALDAVEALPRDKRAVFYDNARRVYRLAG